MTFEWYEHAVYSVISFLLFCLETTLEEDNWMNRHCYGFFFRKYLVTAMFKVLYQQFRGNLTTAFERHLTTEMFYGHRCQALTKTFDLLLYASVSLSLFLSFFLKQA